MGNSAEHKNITRTSLQIILTFMLIVITIGAASIPFLFESQSIHYKFGIEKTVLRTGKILGLIAAVLMVLQLILISRFEILEKIFSQKMLYTLHQQNGKLIALLVVIHPLLISGADHFAMYTPEWRYWPEFIGMALLVITLSTAAVSIWRAGLNLSIKTWRLIHRIATPLIMILLFTHAFFVSESFNRLIPKTALIVTASTVLLMLSRIYYKRAVKNRLE